MTLILANLGLRAMMRELIGVYEEKPTSSDRISKFTSEPFTKPKEYNFRFSFNANLNFSAELSSELDRLKRSWSDRGKSLISSNCNSLRITRSKSEKVMESSTFTWILLGAVTTSLIMIMRRNGRGKGEREGRREGGKEGGDGLIVSDADSDNGGLEFIWNTVHGLAIPHQQLP